jgi:hypothetical protein
MTTTDHARVRSWVAAELTSADPPLIADFLATTPGLGGRKFAADSRDIEEQLDGAYPGAVQVLRSHTGSVLGYAVLHRPDGVEPEVVGDFVFHPEAPWDAVDGVVADIVDRFHRVAVGNAYLRTYIGADQPAALTALANRGAAWSGSSSAPASPCSTRIRPIWSRRTSTV